MKEILKHLEAAQAGLREAIANGAGNLDTAYAQTKAAAESVAARVKATADAPAAKSGKK